VNLDKIKVVRACANIEKYRRIPVINRQRNVILTGCRLVKKGIRFLIMALEKLVPKFPGLSLKIFGTGEEEQELRALVSQLSLEKHVYFLGDVDDAELLRLYNEA
jgi:glycosyltransferase involved in cell wall biosynthesis